MEIVLYCIIIGIVIGLTYVLCSGYGIATASPTTFVTFINENPGETTLGLAKFTVENGNKTDYKLMNMKWTDKVKIIDLEPGVYGVTQYVPMYDRIVSYQTFEVKDKPIVVKFRELF